MKGHMPVTARERDNLAAGRAARSLAWITSNVFGDWAVQSGWFARALTILDEAGEERAEAGWVLILKSFSEPDVNGREERSDPPARPAPRL